MSCEGSFSWQRKKIQQIINSTGKTIKGICGHQQKMYMFIKLVFVPTDDNCLPAYKGNWIGFKDVQVEGNCVLLNANKIIWAASFSVGRAAMPNK
jgi:hypothetical protein